jgi:hypothetical protein
MVKHIALEILRAVRVIVIGVVADDDIGIADNIFDETHLRKSGHRVRIEWAGTVHVDS